MAHYEAAADVPIDVLIPVADKLTAHLHACDARMTDKMNDGRPHSCCGSVSLYVLSTSTQWDGSGSSFEDSVAPRRVPVGEKTDRVVPADLQYGLEILVRESRNSKVGHREAELIASSYNENQKKTGHTVVARIGRTFSILLE